MIGAGSGLECVRGHDSERARERESERMENERPSERAKRERKIHSLRETAILKLVVCRQC